ncbi:MAG: hypothetical protein P0S95_07135 [Rhabdochlamydiaceae bacterium]|nr:hypothetical protein [Candidatus Amphrikana amoebophyrae]
MKPASATRTFWDSTADNVLLSVLERMGYDINGLPWDSNQFSWLKVSKEVAQRGYLYSKKRVRERTIHYLMSQIVFYERPKISPPKFKVSSISSRETTIISSLYYRFKGEFAQISKALWFINEQLIVSEGSKALFPRGYRSGLSLKNLINAAIRKQRREARKTTTLADLSKTLLKKDAVITVLNAFENITPEDAKIVDLAVENIPMHNKIRNKRKIVRPTREASKHRRRLSLTVEPGSPSSSAFRSPHTVVPYAAGGAYPCAQPQPSLYAAASAQDASTQVSNVELGVLPACGIARPELQAGTKATRVSNIMLTPGSQKVTDTENKTKESRVNSALVVGEKACSSASSAAQVVSELEPRGALPPKKYWLKRAKASGYSFN